MGGQRRADPDGQRTPLDRAERAVLGGLLLTTTPSLLLRVRTLLAPGMFSCLRHNAIYAAACSLADRGAPVDQVTCGVLLREQGVLGRIGGAAAFDGLTDEVALDAKIDSYCQLIREQHCRRRLVRAARQIAVEGEAGVEDVPGYLEAARTRVAGISGTVYAAEGEPDMRSATMDAYNEALSDDLPAGMVPTGFVGFDHANRGLFPCHIIVGGFAGMGKTTLAENLLLNVSRGGRRVLFYSGEDRRRIVLWRMMAILAGIDSRRILQHRLRAEDYPRLTDSAGLLRELPITIDDRVGLNVAKISADALRRMDEDPYDLVVVDHLGKIWEPGKPYERITAASAGLTKLQGNLKIPMVTLCQLSRYERKTEVRPPNLGDLRDSGMIEADARMVLLLHRPHWFWEAGKITAPTPEPDPHELGMAVAKNNYGVTGAVRLYIDLPSGYIGDPPGAVPSEEGY